jgi:hypothetical protein
MVSHLKSQYSHVGNLFQNEYYSGICNLHSSYDEELESWYYFNFRSGESRWEHPLDDMYRNLVRRARSESISSAGTFYNVFYLLQKTVIRINIMVVKERKGCRECHVHSSASY